MLKVDDILKLQQLQFYYIYIYIYPFIYKTGGSSSTITYKIMKHESRMKYILIKLNTNLQGNVFGIIEVNASSVKHNFLISQMKHFGDFNLHLDILSATITTFNDILVFFDLTGFNNI